MLRQLHEETLQSRRRKLELEGELTGTTKEHETENKDLISTRAIVIVDNQGIIQHASLFGESISPHVEDILHQVRALKYVGGFNGELCPSLWSEGQCGIQIPMPPMPLWNEVSQDMDKERIYSIVDC